MEATWRESIDRLGKKGDGEGLWRLAQGLPPGLALRALRRLARLGFAPRGERAAYAELAEAAAAFEAAARGGEHALPPPPLAPVPLAAPRVGFPAVALSPDGRVLGAASRAAVHFWRLPDLAPLEPWRLVEEEAWRRPWDLAAGLALAEGARGPTAALAQGSGALSLAPPGRPERVLRLSAGVTWPWRDPHPVPLLAADGDLVALWAQESLQLWTVAGMPLEPPEEVPAPLVALAAGDGHLAAAGELGIRVWRPRASSLPFLAPALAGATCLALAPDALAAGTEGGEIRVWRLSTGEPLARFEAPGRQGVRALAFAPEAPILVGALDDRRLHLWSLPGGHHLQAAGGHAHRLAALAAAPGGWLASGGEQRHRLAYLEGEGELCLWRLSPDPLLRIARLPPGRVAPEDLAAVREAPPDHPQAAWWTFWLAWLGWQRRFEIEIGGPMAFEGGAAATDPALE